MNDSVTHSGETDIERKLTSVSQQRVLLAACAILFLALGARQGFGLLMAPTMEGAGLTREQFSVAVATQYLVWGVTSPLAGLLADRWGPRKILGTGGALYTLGWITAALSDSAQSYWWSAGVLIGLGLGGASFGVVHAVVAQAFPAERRGSALGMVGAATALGQLLLLLFTDWSLSAFSWREAMLCHAAAVFLIVVASCLMGSSAGIQRSGTSGWGVIQKAYARRQFWMISVAFAFSGFQVMATMTHLPALAADLTFSGETALSALIAVSVTGFAGSWALGRLSDHYPGHIVLSCVYTTRACLALVLAICPLNPATFVVLFLLVGIVWMSPIPLTSVLCAQWFGTKRLASIFSAVFLFHQIGGFAGTWLAALVRSETQSYRPMWLIAAVLCAVGAALVAALGMPPKGPEND